MNVQRSNFPIMPVIHEGPIDINEDSQHARMNFSMREVIDPMHEQRIRRMVDGLPIRAEQITEQEVNQEVRNEQAKPSRFKTAMLNLSIVSGFLSIPSLGFIALGTHGAAVPICMMMFATLCGLIGGRS